MGIVKQCRECGEDVRPYDLAERPLCEACISELEASINNALSHLWTVCEAWEDRGSGDPGHTEVSAAVRRAREYMRGAAHPWHPIGSAPKDGTAILGAEPGCGMAVVKWMASAKGWTDAHGGFLHPTHWMPLPEWPGKEG